MNELSGLQRSRRRFMEACAAGVGALTVLPGVRAFAEAPLDPADYARMVGSRFWLASSQGPEQGDVVLVSFEELTSGASVEQFLLHFRGDGSLPEGLYGATNWDGHPYFDVFIQPGGVDADSHALYRASFARLRE